MGGDAGTLETGAGRILAVQTALFFRYADDPATPYTFHLYGFQTSCDDLKSRMHPTPPTDGGTLYTGPAFMFDLAQGSSGTEGPLQVPTPGTYVLGNDGTQNPRWLLGGTYTIDAVGDPMGTFFDRGSLTLSSFDLSSGQAKGSVSFNWDQTPDMDSVTGTFTATYCDVGI